MGDSPFTFVLWPSRLARNSGMPMPASWWIRVCMSAYICFRFTRSVSLRAATSSWSNLGFFQRDSFHAASDLKNCVRMVSALGRGFTLPKPTGLLSQWLDQ